MSKISGPLTKLLAIEAIFAFAVTLASPFVSIFLFRSELGMIDIAIFYGLIFGLTVLFCVLLQYRPVRDARMCISLAMALQVAFFLSLLFLPIPLLFLIGPVLFALYIILFWLSFNFLFIELTTRSDRGTTVGITFFLFPIIQLFTPLLAGLMIDHSGYVPLFVLAAIVLGVNIFLPWIFLKGEAGRVKERARISLKPFGARLRAGLVLQGIQDGLIFFLIPLASLELMGGELGVGVALSLFALGGAGGALLFARLSDRTGNRVRYIRIGALLTLVMFLVVGLFPTLYVFLVCVGISYLSIHMSMIFLMTLAVDRVEEHRPSALLSREFLLNLGRALGIVLLVPLWMFVPDLFAGFILAGLAVGASAVTD